MRDTRETLTKIEQAEPLRKSFIGVLVVCLSLFDSATGSLHPSCTHNLWKPHFFIRESVNHQVDTQRAQEPDR